jgi:hypothetical protein
MSSPSNGAGLPLGHPPGFACPVSSSPELLKLLPIDERGQYQSMVDSIATDVERTHKHSGITKFVKHISQVHHFIRRGNMNDPLRGIVCGVEFGRGFVLVNTDRLKKVLYRSKSSMNGGWQRLGYDVMRPSHDIVCLFTALMPNVNPELFAIRQWCVRLVRDGNTLMFASNLSDSMEGVFEADVTPCQIMGPEQPELPPLRELQPNVNFLDIRSLLNPKPIQYP